MATLGEGTFGRVVKVKDMQMLVYIPLNNFYFVVHILNLSLYLQGILYGLEDH